jgi:hypothetical protein
VELVIVAPTLLAISSIILAFPVKPGANVNIAKKIYLKKF